MIFDVPAVFQIRHLPRLKQKCYVFSWLARSLQIQRQFWNN